MKIIHQGVDALGVLRGAEDGDQFLAPAQAEKEDAFTAVEPEFRQVVTS